MFRSCKDTVITSLKVVTEKKKNKRYYCDLCPVDSDHRIWPSESDVEIHRRKVHKRQLIELLKEPKNLMCTICLRRQEDKPSLIAHIKTNHLLTPETSTIIKHEIFICDYCTNIFFNKLLLITHIKYYHLRTVWKRKNQTAVCPYCNKNIAVKSTWFHYLYHGILRTGTCPVCVTPFNDKKDVLNHVECHKGCLSCCLCPYETKKGNLFLNHMEKHKKTVSLEERNDVNEVLKYYVPQRRVSAWNRKCLNVFRGIPLASEIQICVLCRTMCETDEQMLQHIYGDHSPDSENEIKRHLCVCGEEFFNRILLKHHIFTLKGEHKVYEGTEPPTPKQPFVLNSIIDQEITSQNKELQITEDDDDIDRSFGIVIEIREPLESDYDQKLINFESNNDPQQESDYKIRSDDEMQSQIQNESDAQSENEMEIDSDGEFQNEVVSKSNTKMNFDDNDKNIQIQIEIEIEPQLNKMITSQNQNDIVAQIKDKMDTQTPIQVETIAQTQNENAIKIYNQNESLIHALNQNESVTQIQYINDAIAQNEKEATFNFQNITNTDDYKTDTDARKIIINGKRKSESYNNKAKHCAVASKDSNIPEKDTIEILNNTETINSDNIYNENSVTILNKQTDNFNNPIKDNRKNLSTVRLLNNLVKDSWRDSEIEDSVDVHKNVDKDINHMPQIECHHQSSSKKYYQGIAREVSKQDSSGPTISLLRNMDCITESNRGTTVYEVLEALNESSEQSEKINIEDRFM